MIQRSCWLTGVITPSNIKDEASIVLEDSFNLGSNWKNPLHISLLVYIPVLFLEMKRIGWRRDYEIEARCWDGTQDIKGVATKRGAERCFIHWCKTSGE